MFDCAPVQKKPGHLRWTVEEVPQGTCLCGWLAGPQVTIRAHWVNKSSKPCRKWITKGAVLCHCETEPTAIRTIGYVPIITPEREKWVIIVSQTVAETMILFPFGTPLEFKRMNKPKTPLRVKQSSDGRFNKASNESFKRGYKPDCIKRYLVHLWQDPLLASFFGTDQDVSIDQPVVNNATTALLETTTPSDVAEVDTTPLPPLTDVRALRTGKPFG